MVLDISFSFWKLFFYVADPGSRFLATIVGSNRAGDKDVCLLWALCVVR